MSDKHPGNTANLRAPWKKGESGNPAGRPPHTRYISEYIAEYLKKVPKGEVDKRTTEELIALALLRKCMSGDIRAIELTMERTEGKVADKIESDAPINIRFIRGKDK